MSPTGEQTKTARLGDKALVLTDAIAEIKQHWQTYRKEYEAKYYGKK